jgi:hypothetical protein
MSVAMNDVSGFRLLKGTCSLARLQASEHSWKTVKTLAEWLASEHPLTENLKGVTLETVREAYARYRATEPTVVTIVEAGPDGLASAANAMIVTKQHHVTCGCESCKAKAALMAHIVQEDATCGCDVCLAVRAGLDQA